MCRGVSGFPKVNLVTGNGLGRGQEWRLEKVSAVPMATEKTADDMDPSPWQGWKREDAGDAKGESTDPVDGAAREDQGAGFQGTQLGQLDEWWPRAVLGEHSSWGKV